MEKSDGKVGQVRVLVFCESRYPASRRLIKKKIEEVLEKQELAGPVEVSVAIVGNRKMKALNKKYREQDASTDVLSFSILEGQPALLPTDGILRLGDIIISYPLAVVNAGKKEIMVDEEIGNLIEHGLNNLLGLEIRT